MTKIFDYIHSKGCAAMDRRAEAADPELAKRQAARREKPGVVLVTEGPGGIDGFFKDINVRHDYRTWWHTAALHVHWFLQKRGPRALRANAKQFIQRGQRGWSDRDTWGFDSYLCEVIIGGVTKLREDAHGHPADLPNIEAWYAILDEIVDGMNAAKQLISLEYDYKDKQAEKDLHDRHEKAMDHLKEWFFGLWD